MKVTEQEIRPEAIFNEYLELTRKDIITYFEDSERSDFKCPICDIVGDLWVEKNSFEYRKCPECLSIYVSPRPGKSAFDAYYTDSPSTKFWATTFYKVTETARREKLWKPKAQLIKEKIEKLQGDSAVKYIVDIGGGYGVFDEEILKIMDIETIIIEPSIHLAEVCRQKQLTVLEKFMEDISSGDLPEGRKCYVSFELFEHLHDPILFLTTVWKTMKSSDIFIFTTLSGMGVDIQILKENSKALSPPHHLNFMNPISISRLLPQIGFEVIEAITPGKLDLDILKNNIHFLQDAYWINFLEYASEEQLSKMQEFISVVGLSSHMMITCKKT